MTEIKDLLSDKTLKPKNKTEILSTWLLEKELTPSDLFNYAKTAKDTEKATCIEAVEYATLKQASILLKKDFLFVIDSLKAKAPRIKWESAKVIGNTAHLFPEDLDQAIINLLDNTEHKGTVVRWSAAFALGEVLKLNTKHSKTLLPALEMISNNEEKKSIKKKYQDAIKTSMKLS